MRKARFPVRRVLRVGAACGAVVFGVVAYVYLTLPDVRPLARVNPVATSFMALREAEAGPAGPGRRSHRWAPYPRISQHLKRAVLVAEDSAFWDHEGVDVEQIKQSIQVGLERGTAIRGASTITQQLAKNLYLSPSRNPLRKLRELIIARRLEAELPKARIFEIYLNVIEWGDGIWGAEAASRAYFGVSASALSREQAALLAGAIINPRRYSPARPPQRLLRRQQIILARMGSMEPPPPERTVAAPGEVAPANDGEEGAEPEGSVLPDGEDPEGDSPSDPAPSDPAPQPPV